VTGSGDRPDDESRFAGLRERMVVEQLQSRGIRQPEVLDAMRRVPRERFVPASLRRRAYEDGALAIAGGQTISQPFIVAVMTEALALPEWRDEHPDEPVRVLDVGTGSGYQAAVLAAMGAQVTSIERDPALADEARALLAELGYSVEVVVGDGSGGYPEHAPYAGIVVAAAAPDVPDPLTRQLADGGSLVLPVGARYHQELIAVRRREDKLTEFPLEPAIFVPLVGRYGFDDE
jgi:protein-L-isoaspartate(D-aspartate) O-methyltransferase